jgi:hypothetical protein
VPSGLGLAVSLVLVRGDLLHEGVKHVRQHAVLEARRRLVAVHPPIRVVRGVGVQPDRRRQRAWGRAARADGLEPLAAGRSSGHDVEGSEVLSTLEGVASKMALIAELLQSQHLGRGQRGLKSNPDSRPTFSPPAPCRGRRREADAR